MNKGTSSKKYFYSRFSRTCPTKEAKLKAR